jgi:hypothetical protein
MPTTSQSTRRPSRFSAFIRRVFAMSPTYDTPMDQMATGGPTIGLSAEERAAQRGTTLRPDQRSPATINQE